MRLPEFEDCRDLEQLNGGDYFPQKELVCYASNHTNGIVIKNLKTNESVTVTAGGTGEGGPSFSPDGDKILFVSSKNGVGRQAFVYEIKSKSITQITHVKGAVMEPQRSPDGGVVFRDHLRRITECIEFIGCVQCCKRFIVCCICTAGAFCS